MRFGHHLVCAGCSPSCFPIIFDFFLFRLFLHRLHARLKDHSPFTMWTKHHCTEVYAKLQPFHHVGSNLALDFQAFDFDGMERHLKIILWMMESTLQRAIPSPRHMCFWRLSAYRITIASLTASINVNLSLCNKQRWKQKQRPKQAWEWRCRW